MNAILNLSRREFLKAAGGLALGFHLPQSLAQSGPGRRVSADPADCQRPCGRSTGAVALAGSSGRTSASASTCAV